MKIKIMFTELKFSELQRALAITNKVGTNTTACLVLDEEKISIVAGNEVNICNITAAIVLLDKDIKHKNVKLAFQADALHEAFAQHESHEIEMNFDFENNKNVLVTFPHLSSFRSILSEDVEKSHEDFLKKEKKLPFKTVEKSELEAVFSAINRDYTPFEFAQLKSTSDGAMLKVQRNNDVFEETLTQKKNLGMDIYFDQNALNQSEQICIHETGRTVEICGFQDNFIIKTSSGVHSFITQGLDNFLQKRPVVFEKVITFIIDGYSMKKEVSELYKIKELKKLGQAMLYFKDSSIMFCAISEHVGNAKMLPVIDLEINDKSAAFMVDLKLLNNLKVLNMVTFDELHGAITKSETGQYFLSFYIDIDKDNAYKSFECVICNNKKQALDKVYEKYQHQLLGQKKYKSKE